METKTKRRTTQTIVAVALLTMVLLCMMAIPATARLAPWGDQYDRQAMVAEADYALNGPYSGPAWIGQWNYMASDPASQAIVVKVGMKPM